LLTQIIRSFQKQYISPTCLSPRWFEAQMTGDSLQNITLPWFYRTRGVALTLYFGSYAAWSLEPDMV